MGFVGLGVMYMSIAQQVFGHWGDSGRNGRMMISGMAGMRPLINVYRQAAWLLSSEMEPNRLGISGRCM